MSTVEADVQISALGRRYVADKIATEEQVIAAQAHAAEHGTSLLAALHSIGGIDYAQAAVSASHQFGIPALDIETLDTQSLPVDLVSENLIRKHSALPVFKRGSRLYIALADPQFIHGLDEIKFHTGLSIEPVLVEYDKLGKLIDKALEAQDTTMSDLLGADISELDIAEESNEEEDNDTSAVADAPIVKFVNKMLADAIKSGASDIHFEPYEKNYRVRFRRDGLLHEAASPPPALAQQIATRLKVMSRMDISERRIPQDGRIRLKVSKQRHIDFRVNSCPTLHGEKLVLRILDSSAADLGIEQLGFEEKQQEAFLSAIRKPYGIILVTGPTGSGKTVTLYTALKMLNRDDNNICTVEDPVEIYVSGINQVNQNQKTGLTFASALRAFLRQDPDIIMVGEIRDLETAEIAVKAAQTGHLVLSTLHTNDAPQSLTRLANMGIAPFNIASSVLLIMAQRLARKLCDHCKKVADIPEKTLLSEGFKKEDLDGLKVYSPVGCSHCNAGYRGRTGLFQVMPVSDQMGRLILEGGNSAELSDLASKEGISNLRESGLSKVKAGMISLEEVNRVTRD